MATINLAPSTHYIAVARRRRQILFATSGGVVLLLILIWLGLFLLVKASESRVNDIQAQVAAVQTQIASSNADVDRIVAFEQRISGLDTLLKNRMTIGPFFTQFEKLLPPTISLVHVELGTATGEIQVDGRASSLDDVAQTVASLNRPDDPVFQAVTINQMVRKTSPTAGEPPFYQFQLTMHLKPNALATAGSATQP